MPLKLHKTITMGYKGAGEKSAKPIVIEGGTLIDATGGPPLEDSVIVVDGERIKSVGRKGEVQIPNRCELINARGKTVLPGFIDGHGHLLDFCGEIYLNLGVTTCPDIQTGRDEFWSLAQKHGTNMGLIRGPRVWVAGRAIGAGPNMQVFGGGIFHGTLADVKTPEQAREAVRRKKQLGLDQLKIMDYLPLDAVKAACDEGRSLGLRATCHSYDVCASAEAGVSGVEHWWSVGFTTISDLQTRKSLIDGRYSARMDSEEIPFYFEPENFDRVIDVLVKRDVSWTPAIATWWRPLSPSAERFKQRELSILKQASYLPPVVRAAVLGIYDKFKKWPADKLDRIKKAYEKLEELMRRYVKAGGTIRAGSDPNQGLPALDVHEELVMFVEAGLTPMQAIQAATINVAKTYGREKDFGTVEAGKIADIMIVDGDPLKDIWATQNVKMLLLNGNAMDIRFHANYKNPIPSPEPWRLVPRQIAIDPRYIPQGSKSTVVTVRATAGSVAPWHKVALNGDLLDTRFVNSKELQATIPAAMLKKAGTHWVNVVSPKESGGSSVSAYLIVPFRGS